MPDYRLEVIRCEHDSFVCQSFVCNEVHARKYYVGNPYSGALYTYPVFCEHCIANMISHLPAEFSPDTAVIEARVRDEMNAKHAKQLRDMLVEHGKVVREQVTAELITQFTKPEFTTPPAPELAEGEEENKLVYRCLDCGEEFETAGALDEHKKTHDSDTAPKRTRKNK